MRSRVAVITESSSCVPKEIAEQHLIKILPLTLVFEDRSYRDGVDISSQEFYELLKKARKLPTSSSPSPGEYLDAFTELAAQSDGIICITLPPHLGMAYNSATEAKRIAKDALPQVRIEVLPCKGPALSGAFVARAASQEAESGGDLDQVIDAANEMMKRVYAFAVLDTLDYLAKGGRVPRAAAWAGSLFKIKPLLDATEDIHLLEATRTRKKALEKLLRIMEQRLDGRAAHVNLMHANVREDAERLKSGIQARFECAEFFMTDFTPVVGTHTGPGTLGIAFYADGPGKIRNGREGRWKR